MRSPSVIPKSGSAATFEGRAAAPHGSASSWSSWSSCLCANPVFLFPFRHYGDGALDSISPPNRTLQNSHAKTLRRQDDVGGVRSLAIRVLGLNGLPDLRACGAAAFLANDAAQTTPDWHTPPNIPHNLLASLRLRVRKFLLFSVGPPDRDTEYHVPLRCVAPPRMIGAAPTREDCPDARLHRFHPGTRARCRDHGGL